MTGAPRGQLRTSREGPAGLDRAIVCLLCASFQIRAVRRTSPLTAGDEGISAFRDPPLHHRIDPPHVHFSRPRPFGGPPSRPWRKGGICLLPFQRPASLPWGKGARSFSGTQSLISTGSSIGVSRSTFTSRSAVPAICHAPRIPGTPPGQPTKSDGHIDLDRCAFTRTGGWSRSRLP